MKSQNIKGISPITKQPFSIQELEAYGHLKDLVEFDKQYKTLDTQDYFDLREDFKAFKKHNPEITQAPASVIEKASFKQLKETNQNLTPKF